MLVSYFVDYADAVREFHIRSQIIALNSQDGAETRPQVLGWWTDTAGTWMVYLETEEIGLAEWMEQAQTASDWPRVRAGLLAIVQLLHVSLNSFPADVAHQNPKSTRHRTVYQSRCYARQPRTHRRSRWLATQRAVPTPA